MPAGVPTGDASRAVIASSCSTEASFMDFGCLRWNWRRCYASMWPVTWRRALPSLTSCRCAETVWNTSTLCTCLQTYIMPRCHAVSLNLIWDNDTTNVDICASAGSLLIAFGQNYFFGFYLHVDLLVEFFCFRPLHGHGTVWKTSWAVSALWKVKLVSNSVAPVVFEEPWKLTPLLSASITLLLITCGTQTKFKKLRELWWNKRSQDPSRT